MQGQFLDRRLLYGSRTQRFVRELLTNSGIFWLFDLVGKATLDGLSVYVTSLPHWVLFGAGMAQAWVISQNEQKIRWWHNFIAPLLYTAIDILLESPTAFFSEPYHLLYWLWAAAMTGAYLIQPLSAMLSTLLKALILVLLLPANYMLAEWNTAIASLTAYWFDEPAHLFILLGTVVLGTTLGVTSVMRDLFERLLYNLAGHFEQVASWAFDPRLIDKAYDDNLALRLQRIERTVLFMDVRGFTPWSETHTPQEVVDMVNRFYHTAEPIIKAHNGFKIQMTGDEIMTRFNTADEALQAALELQQAVANALLPDGLSAGIGMHTGDVIEGLVGGEHTRQYGIFGDTVNTAARLQGQARSNEVVVSAATWHKLNQRPEHLPISQRELTLKGKAHTMQVLVVSSADDSA